MTRVIACTLVVCAVLEGAASARGRRQMAFRVDVRTGQVDALSQVAEAPPGAPWPAPAGDPRRSITSDQRTVLVFEGDPGAPATSKLAWQFTLPGSGEGWMPWRVLQGNTVAVSWREEVPDRPHQYREIVRAIDMPTRKVLWERVDPYHDAPGAFGVGADHLVVDQDSQVLVLETRTGRVVRRIAKTGESFAVASPRPGRAWVQAGSVVECIDDSTMKTVWRTSTQGQLISLSPVPGGDDWLMKTARQTIRLQAADGHLVWSAPSKSTSRPLLRGDRIYEATLSVERTARHAKLSLIARDLRSGKVVREYALADHDGFFDQARAAVVEARDGHVDVAADFIVLD